MQEGKVLIIDGSQRIHRSMKGNRRKERQALEGVAVAVGVGVGAAEHSGSSNGVLLGSLSPIPKLEQIVGEVVVAAAAAGGGGGRGAVGYDQGLVAVSDVAPGMLRELHERVLEGL